MLTVDDFYYEHDQENAYRFGFVAAQSSDIPRALSRNSYFIMNIQGLIILQQISEMLLL